MTDQNKIKKIVVDRDACIGAATCVVVAPQAFDLDDKDIAIVKDGALQSGDAALLAGAQSCPVQAILLFDEEGNQIFPVKK